MNKKTLERLRMAAEILATKYESEDVEHLFKRLKIEYKTMKQDTLSLLELLKV